MHRYKVSENEVMNGKKNGNKILCFQNGFIQNELHFIFNWNLYDWFKNTKTILREGSLSMWIKLCPRIFQTEVVSPLAEAAKDLTSWYHRIS